MRAYWFFVVYVSPVLLVAVCAFLSWEAFKESKRADAEERDGEGSEPKAGENRGEGEAWAADPDAWKRGR